MEPDYVKLREIKPVLAGYIREAQGLLRQSPVPDDKAVHDVRVLMKKCRAVMRLIISQIEKESFQRNYDAFRETGRLLSSWRETSVHRKTLKELKKNHSKLFASLNENEKLALLMRKADIPAEPSPEIKIDLEKIEELLNKAGFRLRFQKMDNMDAKLLLKELENSYNIVVDKYLICRNSPKPANLHMFRKKAKDFLYQLWFFRPLNPAIVKSLEKKLDAMTQNLGKYNDLSQLVATLEYKYSGPGETPAMDELIILVREAQDNYLSKAWPVAYKVFCPGKKLVNILGFRLLMI
ncbi:MAG: CHAD domain-containing protein [Bacteroidia bacterium]|nr:CHAD domain-containing protein [Bacteroidia bacterium]